MHSLHLSFALGSLLAPLISKPFLSDRVYTSNDTENFANITIMENELHLETKITILYPLIGTILVAISFGYLYLGISDKRKFLLHINENTFQIEESESSKEIKKVILMFCYKSIIKTVSLQYNQSI